MRLYLNNADQRSQYELDDGEYLVGRSPRADIRLNRGEVSFEHALLRIDGTHLFVSDLGSRNGTDIDGVNVTSGNHESEVPPQSTVHVAGVSLSRNSPPPHPKAFPPTKTSRPMFTGTWCGN